MKPSDTSESTESLAKPLNVLVVDDNIHDYRLLSVLVNSETRNRYEFKWARNSDEGKQLLESGTYEIVAVDYNLGLEVGSKVMAELSAKYPDPAYLLITANQDPDIYKEGIAAGAESFIPKGRECGPVFDRAAQYAIKRKQLANSLKLTNASKDWLISILAKDLGTPLFQLNKLLSTLRNEGPTMPKEMLQELLETAYSSSCESIAATNEILEWGQSIQGDNQPNMKRANAEI